MTTYEFSIIASGLDPHADDFETRFYNAGCEDATISFQRGHIIVDFARESESIDAAIASAIECVTAAGAQVNRVEPDPLVNLSDIAVRTGMTRAAISHYSKGQRSRDFPAPVARVTSDSPLWDWAAVAKWLFKHDKVTRETALQAKAVKVANEVIEAREPGLREVLQRRLKAYEASLEKEAA